jgi:tryptophanyl-tRNA synthetase
MQTDPARVRRTDPGEPEKCPVYALHKVYSDADILSWVETGCRSAGIGCLDCKKPLIDSIVEEQRPLHERAAEYEGNPDLIRSILEEGRERARDAARDTLDEVRSAMGLNYR